MSQKSLQDKKRRIGTNRENQKNLGFSNQNLAHWAWSGSHTTIRVHMSCGVKWWLFCFWGRSNPVCQVLTIMCSCCMLDSTAFWAGLIILNQHTSTMSSSVHSHVGGWSGWMRQWGENSAVHWRPLWAVEWKLPCFQFLFFSMFIFIFLYTFSLPIKNQLKHHVLCCSMFLYFSLGTWWWVANSALFCFMFLYFSWHLGRHMYFLASIWLQLLKCSGLARTLYPVSSWEGDSTWCFHMWQCLKTCEKLWNKWTAFDSTCTGQDLIELDTW